MRDDNDADSLQQMWRNNPETCRQASQFAAIAANELVQLISDASKSTDPKVSATAARYVAATATHKILTGAK